MVRITHCNGEEVEMADNEFRRLISLADYGIQQKKQLNLPMSLVEQKLEVMIKTELKT